MSCLARAASGESTVGQCSSCGYTLAGSVCVSKCLCSADCASCDCGSCTVCKAGFYLEGTVCHKKKTKGAKCSADEQCAQSKCAGGNCCDTDVLKPGCTDCNFRGLCEGA